MTTPVKASKMFGAGGATGIKNVTAPTPVTMNTLQDWTLTFKRDLKSISGRSQFPDDVCAGASSISWKLTMGSFSGRILSDLVAGAAWASGKQTLEARAEKNVVKADGTFTVANNGAGVFNCDEGIIDPAVNLPLICVTTITKANHYTVNTNGKYTFHSSRIGQTLDSSYLWNGYTGNGVPGATMNITNQPQGKIGDFTLILASEWNFEQNVFKLNSNIVDQFEFGTKGGDYSKPTLSGQVQADAYGNIGTISTAQLR